MARRRARLGCDEEGEEEEVSMSSQLAVAVQLDARVLRRCRAASRARRRGNRVSLEPMRESAKGREDRAHLYLGLAGLKAGDVGLMRGLVGLCRGKETRSGGKARQYEGEMVPARRRRGEPGLTSTQGSSARTSATSVCGGSGEGEREEAEEEGRTTRGGEREGQLLRVEDGRSKMRKLGARELGTHEKAGLAGENLGLAGEKAGLAGEKAGLAGENLGDAGLWTARKRARGSVLIIGMAAAKTTRRRSKREEAMTHENEGEVGLQVRVDRQREVWENGSNETACDSPVSGARRTADEERRERGEARRRERR